MSEGEVNIFLFLIFHISNMSGNVPYLDRRAACRSRCRCWGRSSQLSQSERTQPHSWNVTSSWFWILLPPDVYRGAGSPGLHTLLDSHLWWHEENIPLRLSHCVLLKENLRSFFLPPLEEWFLTYGTRSTGERKANQKTSTRCMPVRAEHTSHT